MDLPDLTHTPILAFFVGFALVFGLAIRFGGWPERVGALILLAMPVLQLTLYSTVASDAYSELDWVSLLSDLVGLVGFGALIRYADRDYWPTAAFGMALISALSHFARINTDMLGFSYAQFKSVPTAAMILLVLAGTVAHQIRLRKHGHDRDWVPVKEYAEFRSLPEKLDEF